MRVVHIAYLYGLNNTGGACMAATRLHLALLRQGVDSHFVCQQQKESGPNVYELPTRGFVRIVQYCITRIVWLLGYLTPEHRIIMPNLVPLLTLKKTLRKINPDIVHIHWYMMDTISFRQLATMPYPVVMTLHDLFDVNIEEPYPASDQRFINGLTRENSSRYERWLFARKSKCMKNLMPFLIGPSNWICATARASIIGRSLNTKVIGNIFDTGFRLDSSLYTRQNKFRILFGANGGRANSKKGWADLMRSLPFISQTIRENIEIIVFGESFPSYIADGVEISFIGSLSTMSSLVQSYHKAELLALPSKEDNAPNVKFEAWLCGLPVIAFNRTGCAEHIVPKCNGWVAQDNDFASFAKGIEYYYQLFTSIEYGIIRKNIAESAANLFGEQSVVQQISKVYSACRR